MEGKDTRDYFRLAGIGIKNENKEGEIDSSDNI
jgi:hypothetical protein